MKRKIISLWDEPGPSVPDNTEPTTSPSEMSMAPSMPPQEYIESQKCTRCDQVFDDLPSLHDHIINYHAWSPKKQKLRLERVEPIVEPVDEEEYAEPDVELEGEEQYAEPDDEPDSEPLQLEPDSEPLQLEPDSEPLQLESDSEPQHVEPEEAVEAEEPEDAIEAENVESMPDLPFPLDFDPDAEGDLGDDIEPFEMGEMLECSLRTETYNCPQCEKTYTTKSGLYNHQATVHRGKKHKCDECDKEYNSKASLLDHKNSKHLGMLFKCDLCDKSYKTKNVLKDHKRNKHSGLSFSCDNCGKTFSSKEGYAYHMKVPCKYKDHSERGEFVCKICNKSCPSKQALWNHDRVVHKGKRYDCKECGKEFSYSSVLKNHIQSVHQGISHKCEICQKTFAQKSGLTFHMKKLHS